MASPPKSPSRTRRGPGRILLVLPAIMLVMAALVAQQGAFVPRYGLDLAGGTTVTLSPVTSDGSRPSRESLDLAVDIIRDRVNGSGISDAETVRSGDTIVVSVPGRGRQEILELVGTTAELRFRPVLAVAPARADAAGAPTPPGTPAASARPEPSAPASPRASGRPYPPATPDPAATPGAPPGGGQGTPAAPDPLAGVDLTGIEPALVEEFRRIDCTARSRGQGVPDDPGERIVACSQDGSSRYILDRAAVRGVDVADATAGVDPAGGEWIVTAEFTGRGATEFARVTGRLTGLPEPRNRLAVVLDGVVVSAPAIREAVPGGTARIGGDFTRETAVRLAHQLRYGALPLRFEPGTVEEISSTLGADQLRGGLLAGGLGLLAVVGYALLYYRGLGLVAVSSLAVAALLTYLSVALLGAYAGFRLSLPHIVGLIVSIGVTADSFIVYFERIRDGLRAGRPLPLAVETGWRRARRTILVADAVTLIAAVTLYLLAVGGVAGFAFAMGLTTLIDLAVVFLFTRPLVTLLARLRFFAEGHRLSGLARPRRTVGAEPAPRGT